MFRTTAEAKGDGLDPVKHLKAPPPPTPPPQQFITDKVLLCYLLFACV